MLNIESDAGDSEKGNGNIFVQICKNFFWDHYVAEDTLDSSQMPIRRRKFRRRDSIADVVARPPIVNLIIQEHVEQMQIDEDDISTSELHSQMQQELINMLSKPIEEVTSNI